MGTVPGFSARESGWRFLCAVCAMALALFAGCPRKASKTVGLRVVSLVPSVTEIVYAVGAADRLAGNTTYCNFPEAARSVCKVGDFLNPDFERIVALRPGIVFLSLPAHRLIAEKLTEAGVAVYVSRPGTIEEVFAEVDSIGRLLGAGERAALVAESLRAELNGLPVYDDTPAVYIEVSDVPLMSAGGTGFLDGIITRAGGRNVFSWLTQEYPIVESEMVVQARPDVMLILHPGVRAVRVGERLGWGRIPAVMNGRVYDDLDLDVLSRPGPRVVDAVREVSRRIHQIRSSEHRQEGD